MATVYTEIPLNFHEIADDVITDTKETSAGIFRSRTCCFYDACSFRRHAKLEKEAADFLFEYVKRQEGLFIITRCILMELASHSGVLNEEYIQYIKIIRRAGINILLMYEEDLFTVMDVCFGANAVINSYLSWAVRMIKNPVSTITDTWNQNGKLREEIIRGKNAESREIYRRFFSAVRNHKESGDNLGEELLSVCLHILSHIPGEEDGKFCIFTDDKGAAGKIAALFQRTARQFRGKRIVIFSTPRLVQVMYHEGILTDKESVKMILSTGSHEKIKVLGTRLYDLWSREMTIDCGELTDLIVQPNGINITF